MSFAPCFAFVFLGAPLVERLQANERLTGALAAVTAAVVGVIANLALWFGLRGLFGSVHLVRLGPFPMGVPVWSSLDATVLALSALSALMLFGLKRGVVPTLGVAALSGLVLHLASGLI